MSGNLSMRHPRVGTQLLNTVDAKAAEQPSGGTCVSLTFTACQFGDGATTVLREFVGAALQSRRRVAVVDLNLGLPEDFSQFDGRKAHVREYLALQNGARIEAPKEGFLWVTCEKPDESLQGDLNVRSLRTLLSRFEGGFDLVLFNGPPMLNNSFSETVVAVADQVYLVVRQERTTYFHVKYALERLSRLGRTPAGLVYNDRAPVIPRLVYDLLFGARKH